MESIPGTEEINAMEMGPWGEDRVKQAQMKQMQTV